MHYFRVVKLLVLVAIFIFSQDVLALQVQPDSTNIQVQTNPISEAIKSFILSKDSSLLLNKELVKRFYEQNQYSLAWGNVGFMNTRAVKELIKQIQESEYDGLNPSDYRVENLEQHLSEINIKRADINYVVQMDILLTDSFLKFAWDSGVGRVDPKKIYVDWDYALKEIDPIVILNNALDKNLVGKSLKDLFPNDERYLKMREALKSYMVKLGKVEWPKVPKAGKKWEKGDSGPYIKALRDRLKVTGEHPNKQIEKEDYFDDELEAAVKKFQEQIGLNADGVVGIYTWESLNVSIKERIVQIKANMERIRWLPHDLGSRYIFVNIPDYNIKLVEQGKTKLVLRSVVGNTAWRTPVFKDEMEFIELNPRWNVPPRIAQKETLPKIKEDPSYVTKMNFSVFKKEDGHNVAVDDPSTIDWSTADAKDFFFSQRSGGGNALGRIKFMFPNKHSIYIHDTPSKYLFKRDIRAYSHGCIRLENPLELAVNVLESKDDKWDKERLTKVIQSNEWKTVMLPQKIPIYLYYLTAWVDSDGKMQFRKDIYEYDSKLAKVLKL